jgi:transcriptional regulator with XRE-family HTH domain
MRIGQKFRFTDGEEMDFPHILRAIKNKHNWKQAALAEKLGMSQANVSRIMKGQEPSWETGSKIIELAKVLGVLSDNRSTPQRTMVVSLVGVVGLGEYIDWVGETDMPLGEIELPFPVKEGCVALEAKGDSQFPRVKNGEILIVRFNNLTAEDMVGQEAVVKLRDGSYLMKTIRRGYKEHCFNLESFNAPTRENEEIEQVASIVAIIPKGMWRSLR